MEFQIVDNENWMRGGMYALLVDGEEVMVSDDKRILLHYAGTLIGR